MPDHDRPNTPIALFLPAKTTLESPAKTGDFQGHIHVDMDALKRQAAARALEHVRDGMKLGLGTGSTAKHFVDLLGEKVRAGHEGDRRADLGGDPRPGQRYAALPLTTLDEVDRLDLTVDGADEVDPALNLIKGGGGALLREKIVAAASDRMIVIADETKWVDALGRFPLPVEVIPFGLAATRRAIANGHLRKAAFPGKWRSARARTATFLSPMAATGLSMPILGRITGCAAPGALAERDPGRRRARSVHRPCQHGRYWRAHREFALLNVKHDPERAG